MFSFVVKLHFPSFRNVCLFLYSIDDQSDNNKILICWKQKWCANLNVFILRYKFTKLYHWQIFVFNKQLLNFVCMKVCWNVFVSALTWHGKIFWNFPNIIMSNFNSWHFLNVWKRFWTGKIFISASNGEDLHGYVCNYINGALHYL